MRSFSSPSTPFPLPPSPPFPCPPLLRPLLSSGSPPLPSPTLPFPSPIHPPIQLMGLGERCELPEGVWAKPGCQTQFGASRVKSGFKECIYVIKLQILFHGGGHSRTKPRWFVWTGGPRLLTAEEVVKDILKFGQKLFRHILMNVHCTK